MLPRKPLSLKLRLKNTQNHDMAKRVGGFVDFGFQTFILQPDEVQRVLSTPPKPFYYMLRTYFFGVGWILAKSRFLPNFLTVLRLKTVHFIVMYFICKFFFTISQPTWWWKNLSENIVLLCHAQEWILIKPFWPLFVTNYCIFRSVMNADCEEKILVHR